MSEAWAQMGGGGAAGGPPAIFNVGFLVAMLAIFYFVLLRPEQKRRKEHEQLIASVKRNDQIVLNSGMHGRVVALADKTVTVEIAPKVQVVFDRAAIQTVVALAGGDAAPEKREKA
jgi:preprotein translocase subunit YajC